MNGGTGHVRGWGGTSVAAASSTDTLAARKTKIKNNNHPMAFQQAHREMRHDQNQKSTQPLVVLTFRAHSLM